MLYTDFIVGGKNYKLRLNTRNIITLENMIGCNPLAVFGDGSTIPEITVMVDILYCSMLQLNHGITINDAYDLFDAYLEEGNSITDFINVILEIYRSSGLIPREKEEAAEKNLKAGE